MNTLLDISVAADLDGVRCLRHACERALLSHGLAEEHRFRLFLGITELATNVVRHSNPSARSLHLLICRDGVRWEFCMRDDGGPFEGFNHCARMISHANSLGEELLEYGMGLPLLVNLLPGIARLAGPGNCYTWCFENSQHMPRVAVVDDDPIMREMIKLYLEDKYRVQLFASSSAALEALVEQRVDIVISDIHMPGMDGITLRQRLAERESTAFIPFIFVTGQDAHDQRELACSLGIDDYLAKPLERDHLREVVGRVYRCSQRLISVAKQSVGSEITLQLRPKVPPGAGGYRLALAHQSAEMGGGDFVFHRVVGTKHTLVLGDCMGHGAQAKIFAHAYQAYLSGALNNLDLTADAGHILSQLSSAMQVDELLGQSLLTCIVLQWQQGGQFEVASAGHPMPWIYTAASAQQLCGGGVLPGLIAGATYPVNQFFLSSGERLCLYTDGLLAGLAPPADEEKALQHLSLLLCQSAGQLLQEQVQWLLAQGASPRDDACVLLLEADA